MEVPLSVDKAVWPSPMADTIVPSSDVWWRLGDLRGALRARGSSVGPAELIALAVWIGPPMARNLLVGRPARRPRPEWTLLGFDVADGGLISGLSNCGWDPDLDDVPAARRRWRPSLNDSGLFMRLDEAVAFAAFSDTRVREHAPFFVHALYHVDWFPRPTRPSQE